MDDHRPTPGRRRRLGALTCSLALLAVLVPPTAAMAHGSCLPMLQSAFHAFVEAVNVFSPVLDTKAEVCVEQFGDVEPVMGREYAPAAARAGAPAAARGEAPAAYAPCRDGLAAGTYPCKNVTMLGHVTMEELGATFINDMWGWTDPKWNKDYAIVGSSTGTHFVDISRPKYPVVKGFMPSASDEGGAFWRDLKVFDDHVFVVSEHDGHGMQVFDLTRLRGRATGVTYEPDAHYDGVGSVHNIAINTETGFAYLLGSSPDQTRSDIACGFGLHIVDVNTPQAPRHAGCWDGDGYVHDAQCIVYDGPDTAYQGREICFNATPLNATNDALAASVSVVDVTDKANPVGLSDIPYDVDGSDAAYSHQGWLTTDRSTYLHGDELEETTFTSPSVAPNTITRVWDVSDLDAPELLEEWQNDTTSIDHNMYVEGDLMYQANYTSGLRVVDVSDAADGELEEVAFFDVYPEDDAATFAGGAWSTYPYFRMQKVVAVSSIDRGLFILRPTVD